MMRLSIFAVVAVMLFRLAGYFNEPQLTDAEIHAISGEPARLTPARRGGQPLTIVSWNIERGLQFQQVAATLKGLTPDIVLLQEVDRYCNRSGNRDIARELGAALGMNWVAGGEFQEIGEANGTPAAITGQAILSREVITDPAVVVFNDQSTLRWRLNPMQPRRGGRVALRAHTGGLIVYSVHLESGGGDRTRTAQLDDVLADQARQPGERVVIGGDFNNRVAFQSFMFHGLTLNGFADALPSGLNDRQTSINHRHEIDWIFVKGLSRSGGRIERVDNISDHYPVVATVALRNP
jgi:endonuclease/exonuclease/phosphatase family metal-dependent hydrolase